VDDAVMGGESSSTFNLNDDGWRFLKAVSLENNGGFSSVRYRFQKIQVKEYTSIVIKLKDGKSINLELNPIQEIIIPT
jgi:hypothetical protein